ncbi:MAG: hypothetical protein H0W67_09650 [Gemmatimonadales bacterium]|nr:hypothetical protein [Gemmatimonadales bacterium]
MPISPLGTGAADSSPTSQALIDRVLARVSDAGLAVDRRAAASRPRATRRRSVAPSPLMTPDGRTPEQVRNARSLRQVFHDLGESYREHRRRTGAPVSPEVRDAACRFRRELDVASLVAVAASLEQVNGLQL